MMTTAMVATKMAKEGRKEGRKEGGRRRGGRADRHFVSSDRFNRIGERRERGRRLSIYLSSEWFGARKALTRNKLSLKCSLKLFFECLRKSACKAHSARRD